METLFNSCKYSDKNTDHSYGPLYDEIFVDLKSTCQQVLELGVKSGESLKIFSSFFEKAHVTGIDIDTSQIVEGIFDNNPRVCVLNRDATTLDTADIFANEFFDVIIDDASHFPEHQLTSLDIFAPKLKSGGFYVIEDIAESSANYLQSELCKLADKHDLILFWYDLRIVKNRFDDIVAVFKKL